MAPPCGSVRAKAGPARDWRERGSLSLHNELWHNELKLRGRVYVDLDGVVMSPAEGLVCGDTAIALERKPSSTLGKKYGVDLRAPWPASIFTGSHGDR